MKKNDKKIVLDLQNESEIFCGLSVEQLLYAAIAGSDYEDVRVVLESTNWLGLCPRCGQTETIERRLIA